MRGQDTIAPVSHGLRVHVAQRRNRENASDMSRATQIQRAHTALQLLEGGATILDTVAQAGYADQPHLHRSLTRFLGQTPDAPRVAIVSRGMASRYWPDESPLGKRIRLMGPNDGWAEVVGVAADAKSRLFAPTATPFLYLPRLQNPSTRSTLLVRTDTESTAAAELVRNAIVETDRSVPILGMRTMEAFYHANAKNLNTVVVRTVAGMGAMGLVLALAGLYGLTTYAVSAEHARSESGWRWVPYPPQCCE
jgi:AraC-like DNA-binding protein